MKKIGKFLSISVITLFSLTNVISLTACSENKNDKSNVETNNNTKVEETNSELLKSSHNGSDLELISWNSFDEGLKKAKAQKKYMFIDFYTEWCSYCKKLDATTYKDKRVYKYLNENFISIKVNAESNKKVTFDGKQMTERELAASFGVNSYPTMFFMLTEKEPIGNLPGYLAPDDFFIVANYVGSDAYKKKSIEEYKKSFKI